MKQSKWLWLWLWCVSACGANGDPGTDSSTQFWRTCGTTSDCNGLACVCGRCSQECDEAVECEQLSQRAVCALPTEGCERPAPICMPEDRVALNGEADSGAPRSVFANVALVAEPSALPVPDGAESYVEPYELQPPPYTCEPMPSSNFTRTDCPSDVPSGPCEGEGLECRYLVTDTCAELYECLYGYWSMIAKECIGEVSGSTLISGDTSCAESAPIADSPCAEDGQICGHDACALGGTPSRRYTCTCGRWTVATTECPRD
jgi:hypothetical protein